MDVMMPRLDGIRATAKLRESTNIPIILLTAKSEDSDKVLGLNIGADDYVTKPFSPAELTARIDALYRRIGGDMAEFSPSCDIEEDGNRYILKFDIPGVKKDQVKVEVDGDRLTVRAERKEEKKSEYKGNWSFGDPSFSTIYFGGNHFWEIKELTKSKRTK
jgi:DNA-binding response OmpR family regulator